MDGKEVLLSKIVAYLKKNLTNERELVHFYICDLGSFSKKNNYERELVHYHLCELNFELVLFK